MVIESVDNKKIKNLRKLNQKKYRDQEEKYIVEGEHLVKEAYENDKLLEIILLDGEEINIDVPKTYVNLNVLKSLTSLDTPYKVMGICKYNDESDKIGNKVLILDGVQDPGNLGTIIRSALAFNVDTIILSDKSVDLYNSKVIRSTQGMHFYLNILRRNLFNEINNLKSNGYKIYGTNVINGIDVKNVKESGKYAIIMGNEGAGMHKDLEKLCDHNIYIEMNSDCESLNVSVATSIILYELNK